MARWGRVDYRQLQRLAKKMEKLERAGFEKFCEDCAKELAARLLAKVIKRTPTRDSEKAPPGVVGGTLKRGWTAKSEREAELSAAFSGDIGAKRYAESLAVRKVGGIYEVEIINPVNYASYVEFGHRTPSHKGWVKGRFMLTISEQELEAQSPQILEKKLMKFLGGVFDAD